MSMKPYFSVADSLRQVIIKELEARLTVEQMQEIATKLELGDLQREAALLPMSPSPAATLWSRAVGHGHVASLMSLLDRHVIEKFPPE